MNRKGRTPWQQGAVRALPLLACASMVCRSAIVDAQSAGSTSSGTTSVTRGSARKASAPRTDPVTQSKLDEWIVRRFRGAQLLPDSGDKAESLVTQSGAPRIEGTRVPEARDTLVALHFNATMWKPSLLVGTMVPLADPTGVASKLQGRVTARRAFRAPRRPGVIAANESDWRIGWAYLVIIPPRSAAAVTSGFEGWLLLEPPIRTRAPARPPSAPSERTRPDALE